MKLFKKPIFVSISPNAQADDVWLAFKLLFQPWKWIEGDAIAKFTAEFQKHIGAKYVFMFDSGRTSLYAIIRALNLQKGDEVLVQAFTCTAAVNPILWVDAKPVYVDIEPDTYNMSPDDLERKITQKSKALIIQHTFGLSADLDRLLSIAKKNKLIVIEDVAHALGAEYNGKKLGTFGDAAFFSFGRYKIISAVFAGVAATNNPSIGKNLEKFYKDCKAPAKYWVFQQLFHPVFLAKAKPFYNIFSLGKAAVVIARKLKLISLSVYSEEKSGGHPGFGPSRVPNALAILGLNQLKKLEKFNDRRVEMARIYEKELEKNKNILLPRILTGARPVFLNFPIQASDGDSAYKLIGQGRRQEGIYLENWPNKKVIGPSGTDLAKLQYQIGSCPIAEAVAPRVITLPTTPHTTDADALRVTALINNFFK